MPNSYIYSVSEYISLVNENLSKLYGEVAGEICDLKIPASGHVYITLKDKNEGNILPCTIWSSDYKLSGVELELGMEVLVKGRPNFYGPFGKLSFISKHVELVGDGALKIAYEKLKQKLTAEGLFEQGKKRTIPLFPQKIGIITSVHGAVIHDFSNNLGRFGFKVKILDTRVEGPQSGRSLALSVRALKTEDIDVLVLMRGGGSIQSLAGFDNEALVREIASFPVPVIAGIGHHQDVPLAALAADAMESTPSLVATLLNNSWQQARHSVEQSQHKIFNAYELNLYSSSENLDTIFTRVTHFLNAILEKYHQVEQSLKDILVRIEFQLSRSREQLQTMKKAIVKDFTASVVRVKFDYLIRKQAGIQNVFSKNIRDTSYSLNRIERLIQANNPERQLKLGYSIASVNGKIIRTIEDVKIGDQVNMQVIDGNIQSEIKTIK